MHAELTDRAKEFVADHGYDPVYGARPLKRYLQKYVETLAAKIILSSRRFKNSGRKCARRSFIAMSSASLRIFPSSSICYDNTVSQEEFDQKEKEDAQRSSNTFKLCQHPVKPSAFGWWFVPDFLLTVVPPGNHLAQRR